MLCTDTVLANFNPARQIGISCDASNVGIAAVLLHRYDDACDSPIVNVSKALMDTKRRYSQIYSVERGSGGHLWTEEVSPIPVWKKLHSTYGSQTTGYSSRAH